MFLFVPLLLILSSLICISIIIFRKKSYINKLYTLNTAGENTIDNFSWRTYSTDLFPELKFIAEKIELSKYKSHWLMEIEKILRKARVMFLKIDRVSDTMIKKIRKIHINAKLNGNLVQENVTDQTPRTEVADLKNVAETGKMSMAFLKNEEERLIIEIAQNPKNGLLYEQLGDVYVEMANFIDAKESYEAAIELNSQNESIRQKLSLVLEKLNPQS